MEVLEMLKNNRNELTLDELNMLIDEINTGVYSQSYKEECLELIADIIYERKHPETETQPLGEPTLVKVDASSHKVNVASNKKQLKELSKKELEDLLILYRTSSVIDEKISEWITSGEIDEEFLFANNASFSKQELLFAYQMLVVPEQKYTERLHVLGDGIIEKTQIISEDYFIKHYEEMHIPSLKTNKKNVWVCDPSQRSNKLLIFIKMKGIKL